MKVVLKRDTIVRHGAGEILDLPEVEAKRLIAFGNAGVFTPAEPVVKKGGKKNAGKGKDGPAADD